MKKATNGQRLFIETSPSSWNWFQQQEEWSCSFIRGTQVLTIYRVYMLAAYCLRVMKILCPQPISWISLSNWICWHCHYSSLPDSPTQFTNNAGQSTAQHTCSDYNLWLQPCILGCICKFSQCFAWIINSRLYITGAIHILSEVTAYQFPSSHVEKISMLFNHSLRTPKLKLSYHATVFQLMPWNKRTRRLQATQTVHWSLVWKFPSWMIASLYVVLLLHSTRAKRF